MKVASARVGRLDPQVEKQFVAGAREAGRFFMNKSKVQRALERLVDRLTELEIPRGRDRLATERRAFCSGFQRVPVVGG